MAQLDRLSALMMHFALDVEPAPAEAAQLFIIEGTTARRVMLTPRAPGECRPGPDGRPDDRPDDQVVFSARVNWGGAQSPMMAALPDCMIHPVDDTAELRAVVDLILAEHDAQRCGAGTVLNRLAEVLFVGLLRAAMQSGRVATGTIAGLSDPRLARALVAMHRAPGRDWSNAALAREAGLSISRFHELSRARVGESPQAYLRRWRLSLARRDIERGDRIDAIARRYGYGSAEALNHAFRRATGLAPTALRRA